jgi:hypothetical protein
VQRSFGPRVLHKWKTTAVGYRFAANSRTPGKFLNRKHGRTGWWIGPFRGCYRIAFVVPFRMEAELEPGVPSISIGSYVRLLRDNRNFRRLWAAQIVS